jgi:hypothetical protein
MLLKGIGDRYPQSGNLYKWMLRMVRDDFKRQRLIKIQFIEVLTVIRG